jgi:hypothetical protein
MTLPPLYLEGLTQRALLGHEKLNVYKLGLIEAILKDALRADEAPDGTAMRSAVQTAVEVAQWEMRPPRAAGPGRQTAT